PSAITRLPLWIWLPSFRYFRFRSLVTSLIFLRASFPESSSAGVGAGLGRASAGGGLGGAGVCGRLGRGGGKGAAWLRGSTARPGCPVPTRPLLTRLTRC